MGTKGTRKKVIKQSKSDIEFEKAKKNVKTIGIVSIIALLIITVIGFVVYGKSSYAALLQSLPNTFTSRTGTSPSSACKDNSSSPACKVLREIGTIDIIHGFQASYNGTLADLYCIEHNKEMKSSVNYTKDASVLSTYPGIVYILDNDKFTTTGAACISSGSCTSSQLHEYLTQIAIWWYIDKVNGCDDDKDYTAKGTVASGVTVDEDGEYKYDDNGDYKFYNNLTAQDKKDISASKYASEIKKLVDGAVAYKGETTNANISLPTTDKITYTLTSDGLMTNEITPTSTASSFSSYNVSVTDSNVKVVNTTGVEQTTFGKGESFKIFIPKSAIPAKGEVTVNVNVEGTFSKKDAFFYKPDDSNVQKTVLGVINNEKQSVKLDLKYEIDLGEGIFKKVEAGTGKQISGAVLTVVDSEGNTVDTITTTDEAKTLILPVGKYTVTETTIPDGYSAEKTTYEFEIKKDETTEIVLENTKEIDVPNTKASINYIYGIGATVIIVGIVFIVVANKTSNEKKKKN